MPAKTRYLAVDDDPAFHLVLTQLMMMLGYAAPVCVSSAAEALALLADPQAEFDAVLLDIQMPGMNGIEACQRMRAMPHHRDTPVMMITTMNGRDYVDQAFAVGATDYLTKPIHRLELQARLGMLDRLAAERKRSRSLLYAMDAMGDLPGVDFDFEDAVSLPKSEMLIDYLGLENHLLTLSRLRLYAHTAIAFQVTGASGLFNRLNRLEYLDYMADVGAAIAAALKSQTFLLAYAGSGEFVCVLNRTQPVDALQIEQDIATELAAFEPIYAKLNLPLPVVRAGTGVSSGLFFPSAVKTMLRRARMAVRGQNWMLSQVMAG
ncbi:MAG: response regulator [Cypionkella sp.]|jgi:CheY-like chemotaxis protein|nr:response regulator [Cypionkella sp.]